MDSDKSLRHKSIDTRLATVEGHIKAVRKMLAEDKDCVQIITQLLAIEKSVKKAGMVMLKDHMEHCVTDAIKDGGEGVERLDEIKKLIGMYL